MTKISIKLFGASAAPNKSKPILLIHQQYEGCITVEKLDDEVGISILINL